MTRGIAETVYVLCALTSATCMGMLVRGYLRRKVRLLLWSSLCFAGLTVNNLVLLFDLIIFPRVDLAVIRSVPALLGLLVLLYGLIWESA